MFTLDQITEIHDRLGSKNTLSPYLRALNDIGVTTYDSFVTDGHSEYFDAAGRALVGPASHERFAIAESCDRERFLAYLTKMEQTNVGYVEMSKAFAEHGVEKWTFDTERLTLTYLDRAGNVLLSENVG